MIANERQYRITKAQAARFEAALAERDHRPAEPGEHPRLRRVELDALRGQLDDLRAQLADYDALRAGRVPAPDLADYEDLPRALIRARIAAGLTQGDLAERLGIAEQQVQRYEATEYTQASFARLREVMTALRHPTPGAA
jgi:ribosome-binding protein aMBF1 (putative translation factor)